MGKRPRLAVLDIGSNTVRLLVAALEGGVPVTVFDRSEFVRLGLGVDQTRRLDPEREDVALAAIRYLATEARSQGAEHLIAIATSAVRDAANGPAFVRRVEAETGIPVETLSGEREAYLTYLGATCGVNICHHILVVDLGGGSVELVAATPGGMRWARSLPLGSGRLSERFIHHDPPTEQELANLEGAVRHALEQLPAARPASAILTGGTATQAGRLAGNKGTRVTLDLATLQTVLTLLQREPSAEIVRRFGVRERRAQVLPAGVAALVAIADFYEVCQLTITAHGIREGAILAYLAER